MFERTSRGLIALVPPRPVVRQNKPLAFYKQGFENV